MANWLHGIDAGCLLSRVACRPRMGNVPTRLSAEVCPGEQAHRASALLGVAMAALVAPVAPPRVTRMAYLGLVEPAVVLVGKFLLRPLETVAERVQAARILAFGQARDGKQPVGFECYARRRPAVAVAMVLDGGAVVLRRRGGPVFA